MVYNPDLRPRGGSVVEIVGLPMDFDEHLVEMPLILWAWPATAQPVRVDLPEFWHHCRIRAASKSRDHGWVLRRHAGTGVFASGLVDIAGGWGGCSGCGGAADLRG
jgi:hypothetical protein